MNPLAVALRRLQQMRGWPTSTLAARARVAYSTTEHVFFGRRHGSIRTYLALAGALDARYLLVPCDLTRPGNVAFLVEQLGLPPSEAYVVRQSVLAASRSANQLPVPSPAGVRESRSLVE